MHLGKYLLSFTMSRHHRGMCLVVTPFGLPRLNVLPDHDDRKQHKLKERLCDPGHNDDRVPRSECRGQRNDCEDCEGNRGPHGSHHRGDTFTPRIKDVAQPALKSGLFGHDRSLFVVETKGIDVPSKDGACRGVSCVRITFETLGMWFW